MAASVKVGTFATGTGTTTVSVAGVGFQPNAVILLGCRRAAVGSGSADVNFSLGFSAGNGDRGSTIRSADNVALSDTGRGRHGTASVVGYIQDGTDAFLGEAQLTFTADGFDVTISAAFGTSFEFVYLALGGDVTDAAVSNQTYNGLTGVQAVVTGLSFMPKAALFLGSSIAGTGTVPVAGGSMILGCTTGTPTGENWIITVASQDAQATTNTSRYGKSGECLTQMTTSGTIIGRAILSSFNSDGLSLNFLEAGTSGWEYHVISLGGAAKFLAGNFLSRTDTTQTVVSTPGMNPKALLIASHNTVESTVDTKQDHLSISVGVATSPTARHCVVATEKDAVALSVGWTSYHSDAVYARGDFADIEVGLMDIAELGTGTGQFEFVMDDADPDAAFVGFLAIGDAPGGSALAKIRRNWDQM